MRTVLISTVMLISAVPIFGQSVQSEVQVQNPVTMVSKQPMVNQPSMPRGAATSSAAEAPPEAPLVTLEGICDQPGAPGTKTCKTVITHAHIDSLIDALVPEASPAVRRRFAINYARLLAASSLAQSQQIEKDPAVAGELRAQLELVRMQVLAASFYHQMEERAANVPTAEIQQYYLAHKADYDEGDVRRLSVPSSGLTMSGQPLDAAGVKANLAGILARASKGEDFDELQQDAYKTFSIDAPTPPTKLSKVRRTNLLPGEEKVFDLKVGEVSQILDSPEGLVILKLESKYTLPIEVVEPDIKATLHQERMAQELQSAEKSVKAQFDLAYLALSSAPELFIPSATASLSAPKGIASDLRPATPARRRRQLSNPGIKALSQSR